MVNKVRSSMSPMDLEQLQAQASAEAASDLPTAFPVKDWNMQAIIEEDANLLQFALMHYRISLTAQLARAQLELEHPQGISPRPSDVRRQELDAALLLMQALDEFEARVEL